MVRPIPWILLLAWASPAVATGFDEDPCRQQSLTSGRVQQVDAQVHAATGLHLEDRKPFACRNAGYVTVYGTTRHVTDPDGSERWYEAHCEYRRMFSTKMDCRFIGQRIVRVSRGPGREGEARVFIPLESDGALIRRRLDDALALASTLGEQNACDPQPAAAQQILELRADLSYPSSGLQVAMEGERFTLWTLRYAVHFTAGTPDSALHLRCWRPKKSPHECLTSSCPA